MVVADTMDSYQAATTDQLIVDYTNYVGACERIQRTPIPLPYTRHLSRCLTRPCQLPCGADRSFISNDSPAVQDLELGTAWANCAHALIQRQASHLLRWQA